MFSVLVIFLTLSPADIKLVEGNEVMDVDTIPIQLLENNGFEQEDPDGLIWQMLGVNVNENAIIDNHHSGIYMDPYEGEFIGYGYPKISGSEGEGWVGLRQELEPKQFKDVDSLSVYLQWKPSSAGISESYSVNLEGDKDTIIVNYLAPIMDGSDNQHVIEMGTPAEGQWYELKLEEIGQLARDYGIEEQKLRSILIKNFAYKDLNMGTFTQQLGTDEVYLWAHEIETGIEERPAQRLITALELQSGSIVLSCAVPASTPYTLSIFDVSGREVYSRTDNVSGSGQITCNPISLSEGVYFWKVATGAGDGAGKFVWVK